MKVKELIDELKKHDQEMEVVTEYEATYYPVDTLSIEIDERYESGVRRLIKTSVLYIH